MPLCNIKRVIITSIYYWCYCTAEMRQPAVNIDVTLCITFSRSKIELYSYLLLIQFGSLCQSYFFMLRG